MPESALYYPSPIALVLAGGKSSRMGNDKAMIHYHGGPHYIHLAKICRTLGLITVLASKHLRHDPAFNTTIADAPHFAGHGPISGLLTAYEMFSCPVLLIGCDYPLLDEHTLQKLLSKRGYASAYVDEQGRLLPMPALYETEALSALLKAFHQGSDSLSRFLENDRSKINELHADDGLKLSSADTPEQRERFLQIIKASDSRLP